MSEHTRRRFVRIAAATAVVGVAGCSEGDDGGGGGTTDAMDDGMTETDAMDDGMTETDAMDDDDTSDDDGMSDPSVTFTVRVENTAPTDVYSDDTATGGQVWITPGAYATYEGENPVYTQGEPASIGLEALAEAGPPTGFEGEPGLVDELAEAENVASAGAYGPSATVEDPNDPTGEVPGAPPIAPGGIFEFEVEAEPGRLFNFASMFVPSNDVFISSESGIELFDEGEPVTGEVGDDVVLWDAGTEVNGPPGSSPTGAPLQGQNGGPRAGATEGVVRPLDATDDGFAYADPSEVVDVVVTPGDDGSFAVRIENTAPTDFYGADTATGGQVWITPGAYAVHSGSNPVFEQGEPATIGLEALAEAGPPTGFEGEPGLVDELAEAENVASAGAYGPAATVEDPNDPTGEVPGAPPIAPGGAFEFTVEADPGDRLSFASMYVPSNDVFISPETGIDLYDDREPVTGSVGDDVALWDAGTEVNGPPGRDPTGAPLQGQNGGPRAGATEGVVRRLDTVDDAFDYPDPGDILSITVEPQ